MLLASRQSGKSQVVSAKVLHEALTHPRRLILLLSPTLRQSGELFRERLLPLWRASGSPCFSQDPTQLELRLSNGSRIVSLPESESTIRCFSGVAHLVVDEAARVSDDLIKAVHPMLATTNGKITALSTPFGQRGWFYDAWFGVKHWHRVKIQATDCPRITAEFLADEREELGQAWYDQEYMCLFGALVGALWPPDQLTDAVYYDEFPSDREVHPVWTVMAVDGSKGEKEIHDWQAFVRVAYMNTGHYFVEAQFHRLDDLRLFAKAEELIDFWKPDVSVIETAHAGYVLFNQLKRAGRKVLGRGRPGSVKKFDRIATRLTGLWSRAKIKIKRDRGGRELLTQCQQYPSKDAHDDGPDALECGVEAITQLLLPKGHILKNVRYET